MIDARLSECSNRKMLLFLEVKGNYCKLPLISPAACQPCRMSALPLVSPAAYQPCRLSAFPLIDPSTYKQNFILLPII